jgi:hypothetical protein
MGRPPFFAANRRIICRTEQVLNPRVTGASARELVADQSGQK